MTTKNRILVVDDEKDILELLKYNLDKEGYQVKTTADSRNAVKLAMEFKPDLILLDLNLPIKSGREVLQEIKQDKRICDIPVIIFSSSRSKDDIDQMYELGALSFISKPENLDNFTDLVQELENFWMNVSASSSE